MTMTEKSQDWQSGRDAQFVLHPHRSLSERGFLILMLAVGGVSFVMGIAFLMMGAWPVFGFFGLDVALIYIAFRLNFRSGRLFEAIHLTPETFELVRHHPSGKQQVFRCNPYWARIQFSEDRPDGRTSLRIAAEGRQFRFAEFLTDDERRELADELKGALMRARSTAF